MLTPSELRNAQFSKARLGGYVMSEVDKLLDDDAPLPYLAGEPPLDDDEIDYSGIHSLNLGDSLEFGTEFDIATGKRR